MIDKYGAITDQNGDQGDSCNFTCTGIALGIYNDKPTIKYNLIDMFWNNGHPVRHPFGGPNYSNPKNFTRDQAIPLMQVLSPSKIISFLETNRWFFPNFERDYAGSAKCPWPHRFCKDSRPFVHNLPLFGKIDLPPGCEVEFKWFDYADPMTPDFTAMALIKAGVTPSRLHLKIAKWLCRKAIEDHCERAKDKSFADFKQLYFTAKALGLHHEFAEAHPWSLYFASWEYFDNRRNLQDLDVAFQKEFQREGIKE